MHPIVPSPRASGIRRRRSLAERRKTRTPKAAFPVFIAYADIPAARRAMTMLSERMARNGDAAHSLQPMLWRFDQLDGSRWMEMALADASRAAVIVIAMSAITPLNGSAEAWLTELAVRHRGSSIRVVTLFDDDLWTVALEQTAAGASAAPAEKKNPATLVALPEKNIAACAA